MKKGKSIAGFFSITEFVEKMLRRSGIDLAETASRIDAGAKKIVDNLNATDRLIADENLVAHLKRITEALDNNAVKIDALYAKCDSIERQGELDRATTLDLLEAVTIMINLGHEQLERLQRLESVTRERSQ